MKPNSQDTVVSKGMRVEFDGFFDHSGEALCIGNDEQWHTFIVRGYLLDNLSIRLLSFPNGTLEFVSRYGARRLNNTGGYTRTDLTPEDPNFRRYETKLEEANL